MLIFFKNVAKTLYIIIHLIKNKEWLRVKRQCHKLTVQRALHTDMKLEKESCHAFVSDIFD